MYRTVSIQANILFILWQMPLLSILWLVCGGTEGKQGQVSLLAVLTTNSVRLTYKQIILIHFLNMFLSNSIQKLYYQRRKKISEIDLIILGVRELAFLGNLRYYWFLKFWFRNGLPPTQLFGMKRAIAIGQVASPCQLPWQCYFQTLIQKANKKKKKSEEVTKLFNLFLNLNHHKSGTYFARFISRFHFALYQIVI